MRRGLVAVAVAGLCATVLMGGACRVQAQAPPAALQGGKAPVFVWWEGEEPERTNLPKRTWFSPQPNERDVLSGGDWLTHEGKAADELFAVYRVRVPEAGEYNLWCRKFWKHGPFRWRFGEQPWQVCDRDVALADEAVLRTHVVANWVYLGTVKLPAGDTTFELRLLAKPGEDVAAGFDCFLLIRGPFMPNGKLKPGERWGRADPGYFPWEPQLDQFTEDCPIDLRRLNERVAGEHGFIKRTGDRFLRGDGQPVRFWAVDIGPNNVDQDRPSIDYLARALAKRGVNMVRYHGPIFDPEAPDPATVSKKRLDNVLYLVAALKKQGIYTTLSFYFPLWFDVKPTYGIAGFENFENKKPFALIYFEPRLQEIYRSWLRTLLTTPSPYTGVPLAKDPAAAIVELVNEDSLFFWTLSKRNIPPVHWERLERMFAHWLAKKYGSVEAAYAAWGQAGKLGGDDPAGGRMELREAWFMTRDGLRAVNEAQRLRMHDQVQFFSELQRRFYEDTVRFIRDELGYGGLITCSNWKTADDVLLDPIERWTYTAGDVIDCHGYFGGPHEGDGASYSVRVGHRFQSRSALLSPENLPVQVAQLADYPQIISELGWTNPNFYRADCTLMAAAYGSLQGIDGIYFFAVGSNFLRDTTMSKFPVSCPLVAGSFFATALMYRRGDVPEAEAVREVLRLSDLFGLKGSAAVGPMALDQLRAADVPADARLRGPVAALDPLAFYVGRVCRHFGDDPAQSQVANLPAFIDRAARIVKSAGGHAVLDFGRGLLTVNTPRAQAAAGFLGEAGEVKLGDVVIRCGNEYASVAVVSLDEQPLRTARRILIQAVTDEQPYGFRVRADGVIASVGGSLLEVRQIDGTVTVPGGGPVHAVALDENGYPTDKKVEVRTEEGLATIALPRDSLYVLVERG
ncbi:MAG: hypothetical protein H5T86_09545 [Armatimonadetes bacterium]|nr:hypothetical protein [Armatimonadota bacterium]